MQITSAKQPPQRSQDLKTRLAVGASMLQTNRDRALVEIKNEPLDEFLSLCMGLPDTFKPFDDLEGQP